MSCELLIINAPRLAPVLAEHFRAESVDSHEAAVARLNMSEPSVVLIGAAAETIAAGVVFAAEFPHTAFFILSDDAHAGTQALLNVTFLPAATGAVHLEPLISRALKDQEQRRESRELLEGTVAGTVSTLFEVLSITDPYSASLGQRLRYAVDLFCKAARMELSWELETGALLAEIGVLTIPSRVLVKSQSGQELSGFERELIAHIPERGADLLQQVPSFVQVSRILRYHAKNFDGSGVPSDGVSGGRLPVGARILKVLTDLFRLKDAGKTQDEAIADMKAGIRRYDPQLLDVASKAFNVNVPPNIAGKSQPLGVRDLRPGQLLVSNILTEDGVLLIRDGQVISARLLHKLRNFAFTSGIKEPIYVIDLLESREMTTTFQDIAQSETAFHPRARQQAAV